MPSETFPSFAAGSSLFSEGDQGGDLYIIRKGLVLVYKMDGKREVPLSHMKAGEMLGALSILEDGERRTASARCLEETEVQIISREKVRDLVGQLPEWAKTLIKDLIIRVTKADDRAIDLNKRLQELKYSP